ncbi:MAG TPA: glycosyltransferase family 39 protein [Bryobacteraceae bacterium]|nr:glycosyltransferase family 39 protein [Bryobacteraceae bacterium]
MPTRLLCGAAVYLFALTYRCLSHGFDTDDMMNLFGAWHRLPDQVRPVGALFYRVVFEIAGFRPLAFHLADFALIVLNLYLLTRLLQRLGRNPSITAAAVCFGCFQGTMWMIYASTGMVYDVLCATFFYAAILVALERPSWWPVIGALHLLALGSKELGAGLPAVLLAIHFLHRPLRWTAIGVTTLCSLGFAAQRFLIPGPLTGHPAYTPVLTMDRLLENITVYTNMLFSFQIPFHAWSAAVFWLSLFALAAVFRCRRMLLGLLFFWFALGPMLTATPRHAGYVFYVPFAGLALAVGALAIRLRALAPPVRFVRPAMAAAFLLLVVFVHLKQRKAAFARGEHPAGMPVIRELAMVRLPLAQGQRVLLLNSPGIGYSYLGTFTLSLTHRVRDLTVDERPAGSPQDGYDHVLYFPAPR